MKKLGIRLLLSLVLVTTLVIVATMPVSAGKPVRIGITIVDFSEGSITVNYWWDKIGAHYYLIGVYNSTGQALNYTEVDLGGRTPNQSGNVTIINSQITCGQTYSTRIWLERRGLRTIRGATASDEATFSCVPSSLFEEYFSVSDLGYIPFGWTETGNSTNRIDVVNSTYAGGTSPELYFYWGPEFEQATYGVYTPSIDATGVTVALNLTFKHDHWYYYDETPPVSPPYTIAVEVSIDGGTTWGATSFAYSPTGDIGPETVNVDLSAYKGQTINIRWNITGWTYWTDGWYIDDVIVAGY